MSEEVGESNNRICFKCAEKDRVILNHIQTIKELKILVKESHKMAIEILEELPQSELRDFAITEYDKLSAKIDAI